MSERPILLRNLTDRDGRRHDALLRDGRLWFDGAAAGARVFDARGGRLLRGLTDHHLHLMATAAARTSLDLTGLRPEGADFADRLREAAAQGPVRGIGVEDAARLDADLLGRIVAAVPLRLQARTGGLWVLNRAALAALDCADPAFERDAAGRPTGRVWRGDALLRGAGEAPPDLSALGRELASHGITSVTDASVTTDDAQARAIAGAGLPQRLVLMSGGPLGTDSRWQVGPLKIQLDERDLLDLATLLDRIVLARRAGRNVAVHCVTHAELALTLAAFAAGGTEPGDRIEHGGLIPAGAIAVIAELGLMVVSNPGFIAARGERYLRDVPMRDLPDLYRLASLTRAGITLRAGSDAPYGPLDPWRVCRAACDRRTDAGQVIGAAEALTPTAALALHFDAAGPDPVPGQIADLVVLRPDRRPGLDIGPVALTLIGGRPVHIGDPGALGPGPASGET